MGLRAYHGQSEVSQSSGQVERAIGTVKNLVKKAMKDRSDVQLALLNFRNTVSEGYITSTAVIRSPMPNTASNSADQTDSEICSRRVS